MRKKGDRVGAILGSNKGEVNFLGYGIYEGDFVPIEAVGWMAEALREQQIINPRIRLDNGEVVYGCECWWGSENSVKDMLDKYDKITDVSIDTVRLEIVK